MFKRFTNACVRVVNRWLPDAFLFAVILTFVVYVAAMFATGMGPIKVLAAWGNSDGFWGLLAFSMQMALVLVLGSAMASAKPCKKVLRKAAGLCHNNMQAIVITTMVSTVCCWLNWGFGLVAGALLAKEVAKRVPTVDYPLLIASAYSGFVIWHAGLSGSIPLTLVTGAKFGEVTYQAAITETIFHPMNIIMCAVVLLAMPFINYAMHPDRERAVTIDPTLLVEDEDKTYEINTPAEKLEHSKILWGILCLAFLVYIIYYFVTNGFTLGLNIVNMIFMFLGILLHGDLRRYVDAIGDAAAGAAGIDLHGADSQLRMAFLIFRQPVPGFVRGGVVHDQNIAGRCLGLQTGKALPEQLTSVIGHNNGQNRHGFPSLSHLIQATGWLESFLPSSLALPSFSLLIMPPKAVISRIFKSSPKDQFSMYQRSCSTLAGMLVSPR